MSAKILKIGIDPGHGGKDPGAIGPSGLREKDVNLSVALKIQSILTSAGHQVFITRTSDEDMSLVERTDLLNQAKCDIAVSIHTNSFNKPDPKYISVFIQGFGGEAEKLARGIQPHLVEATSWLSGGVRVSNLHMTRETKMPTAVVEMGFISNPVQEKQLADPAFRQKLAGAVAAGILDYAGKEDPAVAESVKVTVKGTEIPGQLIDGKTWVPLRALIEALEPEIIWDEKERTVIVK